MSRFAPKIEREVWRVGDRERVRAALRADELPDEWPFTAATFGDDQASEGAPARFSTGLVAAGLFPLRQCESCGIWTTADDAGCPGHRSLRPAAHRRGGLIGVGRS